MFAPLLFVIKKMIICCWVRSESHFYVASGNAVDTCVACACSIGDVHTCQRWCAAWAERTWRVPIWSMSSYPMALFDFTPPQGTRSSCRCHEDITLPLHSCSCPAGFAQSHGLYSAGGNVAWRLNS